MAGVNVILCFVNRRTIGEYVCQTSSGKLLVSPKLSGEDDGSLAPSALTLFYRRV